MLKIETFPQLGRVKLAAMAWRKSYTTASLSTAWIEINQDVFFLSISTSHIPSCVAIKRWAMQDKMLLTLSQLFAIIYVTS